MAEHYYNPKFQSPRSGKFESNFKGLNIKLFSDDIKFQSPRSGKFESNDYSHAGMASSSLWSRRFNPLDRGNLNQIEEEILHTKCKKKFQSPRSGKFESNMFLKRWILKISNFCFNPLDRGNLNQIPCRWG